jgi:hypothetical protein
MFETPTKRWHKVIRTLAVLIVAIVMLECDWTG